MLPRIHGRPRPQRNLNFHVAAPVTMDFSADGITGQAATSGDGWQRRRRSPLLDRQPRLHEAASEADEADGDLGAAFREIAPVLRLRRVFFALFGLAADLLKAKSSRFFPALI